MPVIVAFFARQLVIIVVQLGIFWVAEKYFVPLLNRAISALMTTLGVSEETAQDIMANEVLQTVEALGLTVAFSRVKLPLKLAEKLGFTSKGFSKRILKPADAQKVAKANLAKAGVAATESAVLAETASIVAKTRGFGLSTVNNFLNVVVKIIGIPVGVGLLLINTIDFAAWPTSTYQSTFQKLFAKFGLKPDANATNSKVLSEDTWNRIFAIYQNLGVVGINDPFKDVNVPFTRQNLVDLVDKVAAQIIAERGRATLGWVIGATQGYMVLIDPVSENRIASAMDSVSSAVSTGSQGGSAPAVAKVFTGIVSQGTLGQGLTFTPRQDDLIESVDELKAAASNNLAPFLASLPSRIVYEVKIVSSVITADGFKQTGKAQQIANGYDALGKTKYKTVVNKFAVLYLYVFTDKKVRSKIATVVLGPVDSVRFKADANAINALNLSLPSLVSTTDLSEVKSIATKEAITIKQPETTQAAMLPTVSVAPSKKSGLYTSEVQPDGKIFIEWIDEKTGTLQDDGYYKIDDPEFLKIVLKRGVQGYKYNDVKKQIVKDTPAPGTAPAVQAGTTTPTGQGVNAATLFEWYQTQGQALPSVSERAKKYEQLGLGQSGFYTGTAEQNTKLLAALKSGATATAFIPPQFNPSIEGGVALRAS